MIAAALLMACARLAPAAPPRPGEPVALGARGGWCWYEEDRVLVDGDAVLIGTIASPSGDVQVTRWDLGDGRAQTAVLHAALQSDDHASPALLRLPDGRYLASYAAHVDNDPRHPDDHLMRWRRTLRPGDVSAWEPERRLSVRAAVSYTNLIRLSAEGGRIYNFHRGVGFDPNWLVSYDDGQTFSYGGRLLHGVPVPGAPGSGRPYVRYASDGGDTVHIVTTDDHPRHRDNSLWHGYLRGGVLYRSDATPIGPLPEGPRGGYTPDQLTQVVAGSPDDVAWTSDLAVDASGRPVVTWSSQHGDADKTHERGGGGMDLRYGWARWEGDRWQVEAIGYAGTRLYAPEVDYAGLVAIDRADPEVVYASTNADPATGEPLRSAADGQRHWELYRGARGRPGEPWSWTPLTHDSAVDNLRPVARDAGPRGTVVIWLRGAYRTYVDYDLEVVGVVLPRGAPPAPAPR